MEWNAGQPTPGLHLSAAVRRINITSAATAVAEIVFFTPSSIDSPNEQIISDSAPNVGTEVVDNSTYAYYLTLSYTTNDLSAATGFGNLQRFYGCSIWYT